MISASNLTDSKKEKPRGCAQKDAGSVPARGGPKAPNYCGLQKQTGQGPFSTGFLPCFLQCLLLEAGHQTRCLLNQCSHAYGQLEKAGNTSTKVSDMTELDICFEVPEAWKKNACV